MTGGSEVCFEFIPSLGFLMSVSAWILFLNACCFHFELEGLGAFGKFCMCDVEAGLGTVYLGKSGKSGGRT